ncbi:MAG: hypothetical protein K6E30_10075 [Lachnospiraceae bacterium]|nr:hypothetical protein [Lachnospiraceae bacterium]
MRTLLLAICPYAIGIIAVLELVIFILLIRRFRESGRKVALFMGLISLGLFLDAAVIVLGRLIGEGALLLFLSRIRYVAHGVLIPLMLIIIPYALEAGGIWKKLTWLLTILLMLLGCAEGFANVLEYSETAGVLRCVSSDATPAWASAVSGILSFGTVIPVIIFGIVIWIRQKDPNIFLAGFLMFLFAGLGPVGGNMDLIFFISMFGELAMVFFYYRYTRRYVSNKKE